MCVWWDKGVKAEWQPSRPLCMWTWWNRAKKGGNHHGPCVCVCGKRSKWSDNHHGLCACVWVGGWVGVMSQRGQSDVNHHSLSRARFCDSRGSVAQWPKAWTQEPDGWGLNLSPSTQCLSFPAQNKYDTNGLYFLALLRELHQSMPAKLLDSAIQSKCHPRICQISSYQVMNSCCRYIDKR